MVCEAPARRHLILNQCDDAAWRLWCAPMVGGSLVKSPRETVGVNYARVPEGEPWIPEKRAISEYPGAHIHNDRSLFLEGELRVGKRQDGELTGPASQSAILRRLYLTHVYGIQFVTIQVSEIAHRHASVAAAATAELEREQRGPMLVVAGYNSDPPNS